MKILWFSVSILLVSYVLMAGEVNPAASSMGEEKLRMPEYSQDFESVATGKLPHGWKSESTNAHGKHPLWRVTQDATAPSGNHVLTMQRAARPYGNSFNICWTDDISFKNGSIEVRIKALTGKIDQGGGIVWRVRDNKNYYIVRYNPLEDNLRFYYVHNGTRTMLSNANIKVTPHSWHHIKIVQRGDKTTVFFDGKPTFDKTDWHFPEAGGVGLWTKADAVTSFDDFIVDTTEVQP